MRRPAGHPGVDEPVVGWQNAKGVVIARNHDGLPGRNDLTKETALDEKGQMVNGRTEKPNKHDILT